MRAVVLFVVVSLALSISTAVFAEHGPVAGFVLGITPVDGNDPSSTTSTTMPGLPPTTTTTLGTTPPTTSPDEIARTEALAAIPDEILAPLGGRQAVTVVAYDTIDSALEGWTGSGAIFTGGMAVLEEGLFTRSEPLQPPFAVVGLVSYGQGGGFEITLDDGTWNTPGFRRWGIYGGDGGFTPNVWQGSSTVGPDAVAIPTEAGTSYWVVLAVSEDRALYGVWEDGSSVEAIGESDELSWAVSEWNLAMQVFPDGGTLIVDEYYILSP